MLNSGVIEVREYVQEDFVGKMSGVQSGLFVVTKNVWSHLPLHWIGRVAISIRGRVSLFLCTE